MDKARRARILERLQAMADRHAELEQKLQDPEVFGNTASYADLAREHGALEKFVSRYRAYLKASKQLEEARSMATEEDDEELRALAEEEAEQLDEVVEARLKDIQELLVTEEPKAQRNVIVEVRAGTGGEEASLFAADLFRMYQRFAESRGFTIEVMHSHPTDLGGLKEIVFGVQGEGAYRTFRFESGGHRVQRVPETEAKGRIHTSACTVAVLPEVQDVDVEIRPDDLRIDLFSASGPGGQHVNKTQSAVRLTHIPTGIVVSCQDEKSQHKNKSRALRILRSRIYDHLEAKRLAERGEMRRSQIGSGDRSDRIRTYNFPQNRVTDHRANVTMYDLENILLGEMDDLIAALDAWFRQRQLEAL